MSSVRMSKTLTDRSSEMLANREPSTLTASPATRLLLLDTAWQKLWVLSSTYWTLATLTYNRPRVTSEVLCKLHPFGLLLPELNVPVHACCYESVCCLRNLDTAQVVSMHVTALVHLGRRQTVQMSCFKFKNLPNEQLLTLLHNLALRCIVLIGYSLANRRRPLESLEKSTPFASSPREVQARPVHYRCSSVHRLVYSSRHS